MNIKELTALRAEKENAMKAIVETRGDSMDAEALSTLKDFKAEIGDIDMKIDGINELRSVALKQSAPIEVRQADKQGELRSAFVDYVKDGGFRAYEQRAGTIVGQGANIVPEVFIKDLQEKILEFGSLYSATQKLVTADNGAVQIPTINDTANAGAWTDEGGAYDVSDFSTGSITMDAWKLTTGMQVSEELLKDSFFDIESYLSNAFATRLARTIELAIIDGDGVKKPEGIIGDAGTKSYTSVASASVTSTDILTAVYELQPTARQGATIYVSDDLMKDLALEVDGNGRPLLQTAFNATQADKIKTTIGGYPVEVNNSLEAVAAGSISCIIGDPKRYMVRTVSDVVIKRDEYSNMSTGMVNFYCHSRLDGKVVNANDSFVKIVTAV